MMPAKEETPLKVDAERAPNNESYQTVSTVADEEPKRKIKRVNYSAKNHVQIIFQMYGSALPQVLPFCIMNVLWTLLIYYLQKSGICDMEFKSGTGHTFMGLLVSFLVVSRSGIAYQRFMTIRNHLSESYRSCRELVQYACVYTFRTQTASATKWRQEVAYRTILMLRVTMDTLRWTSEHIDHWDDSYDPQSENTHRMSNLLSHGARTKIEENFRAPTMFSQILRETIMKHPDFLNYTMPVNEYRDLLNFSTVFIKAC